MAHMQGGRAAELYYSREGCGARLFVRESANKRCGVAKILIRIQRDDRGIRRRGEVDCTAACTLQ